MKDIKKFEIPKLSLTSFYLVDSKLKSLFNQKIVLALDPENQQEKARWIITPLLKEKWEDEKSNLEKKAMKNEFTNTDMEMYYRLTGQFEVFDKQQTIIRLKNQEYKISKIFEDKTP